jgi:hypothetical protein
MDTKTKDRGSTFYMYVYNKEDHKERGLVDIVAR